MPMRQLYQSGVRMPSVQGGNDGRLAGFRLEKNKYIPYHLLARTPQPLQSLRGLRATLFTGSHSSPLESWEL